jgi:exodeoxyribonuclease VIII
MSLAGNVMIDLETTGVTPGCCILSIGACTFDLREEFYSTISLSNSHTRGLFDDPDTIAWWSKQSEKARKEAFSGTKDLLVVLGEFQTWFNRLDGKDKKVWGNGADFDLPILAFAYRLAGIKLPWKPFNGRCYRTLKNLYKSVEGPKFSLDKHDALVDAKIQAEHASRILSIHYSD